MRQSYNERLFEGDGFRAKLHNARFHWFQREVTKVVDAAFSMVELGCFDGRLLNYLPVPPKRYEGFDAGWEGGLAEAQRMYQQHANWHFHQATDPSALNALADKSFEVGASLETFEHVPPDSLEGYIKQLARVIEGHLFVTVPNEKGSVFLAKYFAKRLMIGADRHGYTWMEILNASLGRMEHIRRNDHKGFDYHQVVELIGKHFEVLRVEPLPFSSVPVGLGFTIGIVARTRR